jgi:hypothetical protein
MKVFKQWFKRVRQRIRIRQWLTVEDTVNFCRMTVLTNIKDMIYSLSSIDMTIRCHQLRTNTCKEMLCSNWYIF